MNSKPKVIIIFPKYNVDDSSHFPYWYKVFEQASRELNISILFESGESKNFHKDTYKKFHFQRITIKPINLLERFLVLLTWRLQGYTNIYIHYSYSGVILSRLIKLVFPLKIYYWNCEEYTSKDQNKFLNRILRLIDVLVTGTQKLGESYIKVFNLKKSFKVVPNWVEPLNIQPLRLEKQFKHILFVHHLSPRKGTRELPEIIKKVNQERNDCMFHIVGDGPDLSWLKEQLHYETNVKFYGKVSLQKTAQLFKSCDLFIMPSRAEGFPRVILEAMQYKIPFVASEVGAVSEIISKEQQKYLVPPKQPKFFAEKVKELLDINSTEIVESNFKKVSHFSIKEATNSFLKIFNR